MTDIELPDSLIDQALEEEQLNRSDNSYELDFSIVEASISQLESVEKRIDELKHNLQFAPDVEEYKELCMYVDTHTKITWDLKTYLWDVEDIQDKYELDVYEGVRKTVSSDERAKQAIKKMFWDNISSIKKYARLCDRLKTRYGWLTKIIDWCHDYFYFNSRIW